VICFLHPFAKIVRGTGPDLSRAKLAYAYQGPIDADPVHKSEGHGYTAKQWLIISLECLGRAEHPT
jgi:hypothetical protein